MYKIASASLIALAALTGAAYAQDRPVELRFGFWISPQHPLYPETEIWSESIREASNGSITVRLYPSEQLGHARDHYDLVRDGIADFALVSPGYTPGRFPVFALSENPFLMSDMTAGSQALDDWYRPYAEQEMSDVRLCMAFTHAPGSIHLTRRVEVPSDLQGLSIRPATGTLANYLTSMGATTIQAAAPELYDVISRGTADGTASPYDGLPITGVQDILTFHLDIPMYVGAFVYVMNPATYNRLSPEQQKVIDDHCNTEWAARIVHVWDGFEKKVRQDLMADDKHEFFQPSEEQLQLWKDAAGPVYERWGATLRQNGGDPDAVRAALDASIERFGAGL